MVVFLVALSVLAEKWNGTSKQQIALYGLYFECP
jgi:hypothetical protein